MLKRGQVSVFAIIGIVALVIILMLFFFRNEIAKTIRERPLDPQQYLNQQLNDIKKEIEGCINTETVDAANLLMENGGVFERNTDIIIYNGRNYPILCYAIEDSDSCLSRPLLISNLNEKLNERLITKVSKCASLEAFRNEDYKLETGNISVDSSIRGSDIFVGVEMPVELKKEVYSAKASVFSSVVEIPLGDLVDGANDLLQAEANSTPVDPLAYSISSFNKYIFHS